ncbi:MAG TPA: hypothetical protein VG028_00165 [Terriglobia bacterium]|nr:hypothetical protein [Terriglobia bacterium]
MSLTQSTFDAFKKVVTLDARISELSKVVDAVSQRLENTTDKLAARLESHAERLARLEGKFELLETSLGSRPRRPPR